MKLIATTCPRFVLEPRCLAMSAAFSWRASTAGVQRGRGPRRRLRPGQPVALAKGVLRGLHYQMPPHAQGKLVRVTSGRVFDVAVDVRRSQPTFGRWIGVELSPKITGSCGFRPGSRTASGAERARGLPLQDHPATTHRRRKCQLSGATRKSASGGRLIKTLRFRSGIGCSDVVDGPSLPVTGDSRSVRLVPDLRHRAVVFPPDPSLHGEMSRESVTDPVGTDECRRNRV